MQMFFLSCRLRARAALCGEFRVVRLNSEPDRVLPESTDRRLVDVDLFVPVLLRPADHDLLNPSETFLQDDNTFVHSPTVGANCRGKVTADVRGVGLDYGAFATSVRGTRNHRERETRFIQLRAPGDIVR